MTGVWLYDDPLLSHSGASRTCAGGLLLLEGLWALPAGLELLAGELQAMELGQLPLALHVALAGGQGALKGTIPSACSLLLLLLRLVLRLCFPGPECRGPGPGCEGGGGRGGQTCAAGGAGR